METIVEGMRVADFRKVSLSYRENVSTLVLGLNETNPIPPLGVGYNFCKKNFFLDQLKNATSCHPVFWTGPSVSCIIDHK